MLALCIAAALALSSQQQVHYLDSLPDLGFGGASAAYGINESGIAVGFARGSAGRDVPVRWLRGQVKELTMMPGDQSGVALAVNDSGAACGQSTGFGTLRALVWKNGTVRDLGNLGGRGAKALALNDFGVVVGESYPRGGLLPHAFRWDAATGVMTDLGTLGGYYSSANAVDDAGNVYGMSEDNRRDRKAVCWPAGGGPPILLDPANLLDETSAARSCTRNGVVAGDGIGYPAGPKAFTWTLAGGLQILPNPPGALALRAYDLSAAGTVLLRDIYDVIWVYDLHAGTWLRPNLRIPPHPRARVDAAFEINSAGQIAGRGLDFVTGEARAAWILSPAPGGFGLGEPVPARAGVDNALGAAGARPGATLQLLASLDAGSTHVPGCGNLTLGMLFPRRIDAQIADARGVAVWPQVRVPAILAGRRLLLQALDVPGCRASNVASTDFR